MVTVRFECITEERVSQDYGPFEWVQLTYEVLRVSPDGEVLAWFSKANDYWFIGDKIGEKSYWSDVIIW